tara:strand:- start:80 stop:427 length:348 start_codon:yes stop_codon:yes gene_type:complete
MQKRSGYERLEGGPSLALHRLLDDAAGREADSSRYGDKSQSPDSDARAVRRSQQEPDRQSYRKPVQNDGHRQLVTTAGITAGTRYQGEAICESVESNGNQTQHQGDGVRVAGPAV